MLEAAIVTPLMLLLTIGIMEFGSVFYVLLALQNGVSQATRYGITGNTLPGSSRADSIKAAMRQATPALTIPDGAFSFSHLPAGGSVFVGGTGAPRRGREGDHHLHAGRSSRRSCVRSSRPGG